MKHLFGTVSLFVVISCLTSTALRAQSLNITIESSWDSSTGAAYEYADTSVDYSTGYYYDVCSWPYATGEEDNGAWDNYSTSSYSCGVTDSAVSWSFTANASTVYIEFSVTSTEDIDYYVYNFDGNCGLDGYNCYDYWDAFEMSLLEGSNEGSSYYWNLNGPPAIGYGTTQITQYAHQDFGTFCPYPSGETSQYYLLETSSVYFGAGFKMPLSVPWGWNVTGRQVQEAISNVNITRPGDSTPPCWFSSSGYYYPSFGPGSTWNVHTGNIYGDGGQSDADFIGYSIGAANYFQGLLSGSQSCVMASWTQSMTMSSCSTGFFTAQPYSTNADYFKIYPTYMLGFRQGTGGQAE